MSSQVNAQDTNNSFFFTLIYIVFCTQVNAQDTNNSFFFTLIYIVFCTQVNAQDMIDSLTTKTIFTKGESVTSTMNNVSAIDVRDACVKGIYGRMFVWIVDKINGAIYRPKEAPSHYRKSIGVLDIFGFENFDTNR